MELKEGDKAPGFSAPSTRENPLVLADLLKSKRVVLAFFPKAFTGGWTHELQTLQELYPQFEGAGVEVVGVSADDLETQTRFAASFGQGLPYPLVADSERQVLAAYGTLNPERGTSKRMTFVVERNGTVSYINRQVDPRSDDQYKELLKASGVAAKD